MVPEIAFINVLNILIALLLFLITIRAYLSFKLKIFKDAWLVLTIGSFLWLMGHIALFIGAPKFIHYTLFTLFIIFCAIGIFMLATSAKILGGV
jgi:hypothetical protein